MAKLDFNKRDNAKIHLDLFENNFHLEVCIGLGEKLVLLLTL